MVANCSYSWKCTHFLEVGKQELHLIMYFMTMISYTQSKLYQENCVFIIKDTTCDVLALILNLIQMIQS